MTLKIYWLCSVLLLVLILQSVKLRSYAQAQQRKMSPNPNGESSGFQSFRPSPRFSGNQAGNSPSYPSNPPSYPSNVPVPRIGLNSDTRFNELLPGMEDKSNMHINPNSRTLNYKPPFSPRNNFPPTGVSSDESTDINPNSRTFNYKPPFSPRNNFPPTGVSSDESTDINPNSRTFNYKPPFSPRNNFPPTGVSSDESIENEIPENQIPPSAELNAQDGTNQPDTRRSRGKHKSKKFSYSKYIKRKRHSHSAYGLGQPYYGLGQPAYGLGQPTYGVGKPAYGVGQSGYYDQYSDYSEMQTGFTEIEQFVNNVALGHSFQRLSDNALVIIANNPQLPYIVQNMYQSGSLQGSEIQADVMMQLLTLIKDFRSGEVVREIPFPLVDIIMKLEGAKPLATKVLNWLRRYKSGSMLQLFMQIIQENGGKYIPVYIREWLSMLPTVMEIIAFLEKPGRVQCQQQMDGGVKCSKFVTIKAGTQAFVGDYGSGYGHGYGRQFYEQGIDGGLSLNDNIESELLQFIESISNNMYFDPSPQLLQYVSAEPELYEQLVTVFQRNSLPHVNTMPKKIYSVLKLLSGYKKRIPPSDIDPNILPMIIKLKGGKYLTNYVLNWVLANRSDNMLDILLQVVQESRGRVPPHLGKWIRTLENGEEIMRFLRSPGNIRCNEIGGTIRCTKTSTGGGLQNGFVGGYGQDYDLSANYNVESELLHLIESININIYVDPSPQLLQYVSSEPQLYNKIETIFQHHFPHARTTPRQIYSMLKLQHGYNTHVQPSQVDPDTLAMILNLQGGQNLSNYALDWFLANKSDNILDILLQVIMENSGHIPVYLRQWIMTLKNAAEIMQFLEAPGDVQCNKTPGNGLKCTKRSWTRYRVDGARYSSGHKGGYGFRMMNFGADPKLMLSPFDMSHNSR